MKGCSIQEIHAITFKRIAFSDRHMAFFSRAIHVLDTVIYINHDIIDVNLHGLLLLNLCNNIRKSVCVIIFLDIL